MRFFADGPSIPDILLEQRDEGRVVFLCGAGVSFASGLPGFDKLTEDVIEFFDPPLHSEIHTAFEPWKEKSDGPKIPLDQIFHLLFQEYGCNEVNKVVAQRLATVNENTQCGFEHKLIKRLSTNSNGKPQIVTTNFDRLFELDDPTIPFYEPPAFPDLDLGVSLEGITYLHGRLKNSEEKHHPYILSSADFGRAYLAEGWATNFILKLLKSYTVVLVGYQAEDPQVKYLLQGLNHDKKFDRSRIFSFDQGVHEDIETKWRDRGVTPIAYTEHSDLWKTLTAWAERADDPRKWHNSIMTLAKQNPRKLNAHERGQIAHIIKTTAGAKIFSEAEPSPPAEWLCVFDAYRRRSEKKSDYSNEETFDPLEEYGLDDDPVRQIQHRECPYEHLLDWRHEDGPLNDSIGLDNITNRLPSRLRYLLKWIIKHLNHPVTAWWAVRTNGLHPDLVFEIKRELWRDPSMHFEARNTWYLLLDSMSRNSDLHKDHAWYIFSERVIKEGWTNSTLRFFELNMAPYVEISAPFGLEASKPPFQSWENTSVREVGQWEVKFPMGNNPPVDVPDELLPRVLRILQSQLHSAMELYRELKNTYFLDAPTCYPSVNWQNEIHGNSESHCVFNWYMILFQRLIKTKPEIAKHICLNWSWDDGLYFCKLKLFSLNQPELFEGKEVLPLIMDMPQNTFWGSDFQLELLFLLRDRWPDFSTSGKDCIIERILSGPDKKEGWSEEEYANKRDVYALEYVRWLQLNHVTFSQEYQNKIKKLFSQYPDWSDSWALTLTDTQNTKTYRVNSDESARDIINKPVTEVIEYAKSVHSRELESRTQKRPFTGLVKENPRKALSSLSYKSKSGEYPTEYWSILLDKWPSEVSPKLLRVLLIRLGQLPSDAMSSFINHIARWVERNMSIVLNMDKELAWDTFNLIISKINAFDNGKATKSHIGEVYSGGKLVQQSRRTYHYAINSSVGAIVNGVMKELNSRSLQEKDGVPSDIKNFMEVLTKVSGEGGDHAVLMLTHNIHLLYDLDPVWVKSFMLPWFNFTHNLSEPAWNGLISTKCVPDEELGSILKPIFLCLFPKIYDWDWPNESLRVASEMIIVLALTASDVSDKFTPSETRNSLRKMRDGERQSAIRYLSFIGNRDSKFHSDIIPFFHHVWPREQRFRTSTLISSLISLLGSSGKAFPDLLKAMRWCLVQVEIDRNWMFEFHHETKDKESLATIYPEDVLELCDAVISNGLENVPYDLKTLLGKIEESSPILPRDKRFIRLINIVDSM
ncbi:SIR2 family protein [uncultured Shewanella sp.]|uniref:SIR2 family protein n=1 Tax=uncultured Shewanella sp. TaxID=173975 RepID=UPI002628E813|nr:SIR2 family protein [uncultured Shewanella sp.]